MDEREDLLEPATEREPTAHEHPLVRERGARAPPPVVFLPDQAVVGNEVVVEEDLVEHRVTGELA